MASSTADFATRSFSPGSPTTSRLKRARASVMQSTREALRYLGPEGGSIINVSSVVATAAPANSAVYSGTKAAVDAVATRAPRVGLTLKADLRPGVVDGLTSKVEAVERYLAD